MRWDPKVPGRAYLGNDGGFYRSNNNGASGWVKSTYEPYTQFYSVDVAETNPVLKVGGTQDNGCNRGYNGPLGAWNSIGCGDGLQVIIHPEFPNIVFGCSQYGSCYRSENSGGTPRPSLSTTSQRRNWFTPVQFDPQRSQRHVLRGQHRQPVHRQRPHLAADQSGPHRWRAERSRRLPVGDGDDDRRRSD
jgi:hypothetical protein